MRDSLQPGSFCIVRSLVVTASFMKKASDVALRAAHNWRATLQFSLQFSALVAGFVGLAMGPGTSLTLFLVSLIVASAMVAAMYAAAHETLHRTAFRTPWLNDLVYPIATMTILYIPTCHRYFHLAHHRFTRDPFKDPEIAFGGEPTASVFAYTLWVSGLSLFGFKLLTVLRAAFARGAEMWELFFFYLPERRRTRTRREALFILALHGSLLLAGLFWMPTLLWIFAAQILGHALISIQTAGDHNGLEHTGGIDQTRTVTAGPIVQFLFWNMPYHAEHHAQPTIPFYSLPEVNRQGLIDIEHSEPDYPTYHKDVVRQIKGGGPFIEAPGS